MTLGTHAITGAALASLMPHYPVAAFCVGFVSHFAIDAIPHYDYPIYSEAIDPTHQFGKKTSNRALLHEALHNPSILLRDAFDFSLDAALGIGISIFFFAPTVPFITILAGTAGGILPDPLQFVSKVLPYRPLNALQRFHKAIHASWRMRETGHVWTGIISQLAFVAIVLSIARTI